MKPQRVLVFGASGFVGTYLIDELLSLGHEVTASDISEFGREYFRKKKLAYVEVDIAQRSEFDKLESRHHDLVIHLAACQPANVSGKNQDPVEYVRVNVIGTLNILEHCRRRGIPRIIYASSHRNTQGLWPMKNVIREEDGRSIKFEGEYAMFSISESAAQDCIRHYQEQYGLKSVVFRLPPVYGYGPHTEIFRQGKPVKTGFQVFIERAKAGQPLEVWGDSGAGRDIVYVKDVVSAFVKAMETESATGLFNISSGKKLTLREQAEAIAKLFSSTGKAVPIVERPERPNGIESFVYDISKAKREFGWAPRFSFEEMLLDYVKESESQRYRYLVEKRRATLKEG